jgi:NAD+ synthase (glutamine-hydrolysing)
MLRPKQDLAGTGNYREMRWFSPWKKNHTERFDLRRVLPEELLDLQDSTTCPIGDCVLSTSDCDIGIETCEELFTYETPMYELHVRHTLTSYQNLDRRHLTTPSL